MPHKYWQSLSATLDPAAMAGVLGADLTRPEIASMPFFGSMR